MLSTRRYLCNKMHLEAIPAGCGCIPMIVVGVLLLVLNATQFNLCPRESQLYAH
jgi:hypothetical protein